jgi:hypothetical protein
VVNVTLSERDAAALSVLQRQWAPDYSVTVSDGETWVAASRGMPATTLTADSAEELHALLEQDAAQRRRTGGVIYPFPRVHQPHACWCGTYHTGLQAQELNDP